MTTADRYRAYCQTCRYALEHHTDVGWGVGWYEHPAAVRPHIQPHDPAPVPMAEMIKPNMLCDFCSAPDPVTLLRFHPVRLVGTTQLHDLGEWWGACDTCRAHIHGNRPTGLRAQYLRRHPGVPAGIELVMEMWRLMLAGGVLQETEIPR